MEVKNCKTCGRLFNYLGGPRLCQACARDLEDKFQEVKEYLRERPKNPLVVVSEEMDVSVKQLKQWIREERLTLSDDSQAFLDCENCGANIKTGRFCENCKSKLQNSLNSAIDKPIVHQPKQNRDGNKMRFLDT